MDVDGAPIEGSIEIVVSLFDEQDSATPFWSKTYSEQPVEGGYFAVRLVTDDAGDPIDVADLADGEVWVQTRAAGQDIGGRTLLDSTPYAMMAGGVQLPAAVPGPCEASGLLGYDASSGDVLVCNGATFQVLGSVEPGGDGATDGVVGVRNPGQPGEWALLQADSQTVISNIADWRAFCSAEGLGVPSSSESNANCAENLGTPRYVVTSRCNMYSDSEDTWALNQGVFQDTFPGGNLYYLSYSLVGADSNALRWFRLDCASATAGSRNSTTCPAAGGQTSGAFTVQPGEWVTCARPVQ